MIQHLLYRDWRPCQSQAHRRRLFVLAYLAIVVIDPEDLQNPREILGLVGGVTIPKALM